MAKTHELKIEDIKYEILEKINDFQNEELIDDKEQSYIEELQCEKYGFNSAFKYLEKFIQATMHNMEQKVEIYKEKWKAQEKRIVELYATHDQTTLIKRSDIKTLPRHLSCWAGAILVTQKIILKSIERIFSIILVSKRHCFLSKKLI